MAHYPKGITRGSARLRTKLIEYWSIFGCFRKHTPTVPRASAAAQPATTGYVLSRREQAARFMKFILVACIDVLSWTLVLTVAVLILIVPLILLAVLVAMYLLP